MPFSGWRRRPRSAEFGTPSTRRRTSSKRPQGASLVALEARRDETKQALEAGRAKYEELNDRIERNLLKGRDDKGYWSQVEVYVRDRSEAEFSHGICPECMKKLYGK